MVIIGITGGKFSLLCPNCHSLTSTYKGANKGNGRVGRHLKSLEKIESRK